jgi:UDP-2,4-diacetamido-2,4,6-trideoxy-beta-L-altropyranose hydrolase
MKIVIRADSGSHIGSGHIKRCLVLARELKQSGHEVYFITKKHNQYISEEISNEFKMFTIEKDYLDHQIQSHYESWIGDLQNDLLKTNEFLNQIGQVDLMILDHYSIGYDYEIKLSVSKICVIDDIHYQNHYCHFLINVNPGARPSDYVDLITNTQTRFLFGLNYAIIDKAFHRQTQKGKKILIYFGATDIHNNTKKFVEFFSQKKSNLEFIVVIDKKHPTYSEIESIADKNQNFEIHGLNNYFAQLLDQTYLFIGAGGSTTWERAYIGVPSIILSVAQNQIENCVIAEKFGIAKYLGDSDEVGIVELEELMNFITLQGSKIDQMKYHCHDILDNQGCFRINKIYNFAELNFELQFRIANFDDSDFLFKIRNDEQTRKNSFQSNVISLDEHLAWFDKSLKNRDRQIFIVEKEHKRIGTVRIDYEKSDTYLSWNLDSDSRGQGLGKKMLQEFVCKFPRRYKAKIKMDNTASIRIAENAGFSILFRNDDHILLETMLGSNNGN